MLLPVWGMNTSSNFLRSAFLLLAPATYRHWRNPTPEFVFLTGHRDVAMIREGVPACRRFAMSVFERSTN